MKKLYFRKISVNLIIYPMFFYKSHLAIIFLCFALSFSAEGSTGVSAKKLGSSNTVKKLGGWSIKVSSKELALTTAFKGRPLMALYGPEDNYIFISAEDNRQVSLKLVREKMKKRGGDPSSLKVRKQKTEKVFSFSAEDQVHWISTDGSYLVASAKKPLTKKRYRRLLKKVKRSL